MTITTEEYTKNVRQYHEDVEVYLKKSGEQLRPRYVQPDFSAKHIYEIIDAEPPENIMVEIFGNELFHDIDRFSYLLKDKEMLEKIISYVVKQHKEKEGLKAYIKELKHAIQKQEQKYYDQACNQETGGW